VRLTPLVVAVVVAVAVVAPAGCGADPREEQFVRTVEAGTDAATADEKEPDFDPTLGGPCTEDGQCNDAIACTFDRCDMDLKRCRNTPDDTQCANNSYCDGLEKCVIRQGCTAGAVVTCQEDDPCTLDRCIEATKSCEHRPRDLDGDGDPDNHCVGKRDCDDLDPYVSSTASEICDNGKDDNCNGVVDETGCVAPANDVCANAFPVTKSGTYLLSTVATKRDYTASCSVGTPNASRDIVSTITVPAAAVGPQDVEVWVTAQSSTNEVAVALQGTCGQAGSEISCAHIQGANAARIIARGVAPGTAIHAIVTTQTEGAVDMKVDIRTATPKPTNDGCAAPLPVAIDVPLTVKLIDPSPTDNVPTVCNMGQTGDLTYEFTLAQPRDVRIFASTLEGTGLPIVSLRGATCADELRCRHGTAPPLFARNVGIGKHVFTVSGTRHIDASILVKTYPVTPAPDNQDCGSPPEVTPNTTFNVDLSGQEGAFKNGCLAGSPAAAYSLVLTQPSDVLIIGRFPPNEGGGVSLHDTTGVVPGECTTANSKGCSAGSTPQRLSKRNVPAGTYRVTIQDELGQIVQLSVLTRPAVAPTPVGASDSCVAPFTIPATGGFFSGDTTMIPAADFNAGCDDRRREGSDDAPRPRAGAARRLRHVGVVLHDDPRHPKRRVVSGHGGAERLLRRVQREPQLPRSTSHRRDALGPGRRLQRRPRAVVPRRARPPPDAALSCAGERASERARGLSKAQKETKCSWDWAPRDMSAALEWNTSRLSRFAQASLKERFFFVSPAARCMTKSSRRVGRMARIASAKATMRGTT
jgi:hypothetical protein